MYFFFLLLAILIISIILTIVHDECWLISDFVIGFIFVMYSLLCLGATFSNSEPEKYRLKYDGYIHRLSEIDTYETDEKLKLYKDIYDYNNHVESCKQFLNGRWFNWAVENAFYDMPLIELSEDE